VANLPLWQWYAIPGTALSAVEPLVRPLGNTGPQSKIETWNGASLKREGSVYMLGAAGGHADYAGNEVNALQLNTANPRWVQLRAPSANSAIINGTQFYLDLRPSSTHTYYATQFINALNRMLVFASPGISGSFPSPPAGFPYTGDKRSFSFNVASGDWDAPDYVARFPGSGDFTACLGVKHPWTEDVYYSRNYGDGLYRWTRVSNTWVKLSNVSRSPWYAGAAIDPVRNRMFLFGSYNATGPEVRDLNGSPISARFGGMGTGALTVAGYPGAIYDEKNDCFLAAFNSGGSVRILRINAETWVVDDPQIGGTPPIARKNGIQNSIQYVPELRGFVMANSYSGNVYFVRTAA
jgi:hypothetical protein